MPVAPLHQPPPSAAADTAGAVGAAGAPHRLRAHDHLGLVLQLHAQAGKRVRLPFVLLFVPLFVPAFTRSTCTSTVVGLALQLHTACPSRRADVCKVAEAARFLAAALVVCSLSHANAVPPVWSAAC